MVPGPTTSRCRQRQRQTVRISSWLCDCWTDVRAQLPNLLGQRLDATLNAGLDFLECVVAAQYSDNCQQLLPAEAQNNDAEGSADQSPSWQRR